MPKPAKQTVLITGASSGIGEAAALYLADRGYSVIGTSRCIGRLAKLQNEALNRGHPVTTVELDINSDADVLRVFTRLKESHGAVDILVNNAGYGLWGPVESLSLAQINTLFETNFFAAVR